MQICIYKISLLICTYTYTFHNAAHLIAKEIFCWDVNKNYYFLFT